MEGIFAIIGVFGGIPLSIWIILHHRYKTRAKSTELVQAMIANKKDVTPEMVKAIGFSPKRTHADLRTGLIILAFGIALFLFGRVIPEDEAAIVFGGLAMFPIFIAIAFLLFWYFVSRKDET